MAQTTTVKQHRDMTREGGEKLVTTILLGPHTIQAVEYESNGGYYLRVNGIDVPLRQFRRLTKAG